MSKSIVFKNNVFLDSNGVAYGKNTVANVLNHRFATKLDWLLQDGQTKNLTIKDGWYAFLYMNLHGYKRCIVLITLLNNYANNNVFHADVIYKSEDAAVPTFTFDFATDTLTAKYTSASQARGNLYQLNATL